MEKLFAMMVASNLTVAANRGSAPGLALDPGITDKNTQALNTQVWEQFRIFHNAVCQAMESSSWATPKLGPGTLVGDLVGVATDVITKGPFGGIISQLIKAIPTPPAFNGSIPTPPELAGGSGVKS